MSADVGAADTRALMLAGADLLDDVVVQWSSRPRFELRVIGTTPGIPMADEARAAATDLSPTHLVVRDRRGDPADIDRCRSFLQTAASVSADSVRTVVQTHPLPQNPPAQAYDRWLTSEAIDRGRAHVSIVWHNPLALDFVDCRGERQVLDVDNTWAHVRRPARLLSRELFSGTSHDLEYIATRNP